MKITITEIAKRAGVSKATVSRVLNNKAEGAGSETRARILNIIKETGYKPSGFARGLATGKSLSVGLIIPDITNPFHPQLVRGVEDTLSKAGYSLFLCNSDRNMEKEKRYVEVLIEKGVDGIIINSSSSDCDSQLDLLDSKGIPYVMLDRIIEKRKNQYGIFVDNRRGALTAVSHLLTTGSRSLLYLNGPKDHSQSKLRRAGMEDAIKESGQLHTLVTVLHGDYSRESGEELLTQMLDSHTGWRKTGQLPFDTVFACNDLMAVGALQALEKKGVSIPEQVQVVGFDDIELAQMISPPLTTVSQPTFEMGSKSAEMLLKLLAGKKPRIKSVYLQPKLILRGTTLNM